MREWGIVIASLLFSCGGGSGGGDSTPAPPAASLGNPVGNNAAGPDQSDGIKSTCTSLECLGLDYTRSVLDPNKFVKRCTEGLQMVDDTCAEPRAVITAESHIEFGNTASGTSLFKAHIDGKAELAPYLKKMESNSSNTLQVDYEYWIEGDKEATDRLNLPGILLADDRFDNSDGELYFGVPGFDSNPVAIEANVFGERISGTVPYSRFRDYCEAVVRKFSLIKEGLEITHFPMPDGYDGRERQGCTVANFPGNGIKRITLYSVCRDAERCLLKGVSIWRATP